VTTCVISGHIVSAEPLNEVVIARLGLRGSEPGECFDGTLLEGIGWELGDDALVLRRRDFDGDIVDAIEADAGGDPPGVDVLVLVDAGCPVQGNAVVDALEARRGPRLLAGIVVLDELDGAEGTVNLEALVTIAAYSQYIIYRGLENGVMTH
jgi:hypothetical protein